MTYAAENRLKSRAREYRLYGGMSQLRLAHAAGVALETVRKLDEAKR
jgi:DNA-binding XRE family transcriptional regulator